MAHTLCLHQNVHMNQQIHVNHTDYRAYVYLVRANLTEILTDRAQGHAFATS
jgi:hypothetical protein